MPRQLFPHGQYDRASAIDTPSGGKAAIFIIASLSTEANSQRKTFCPFRGKLFPLRLDLFLNDLREQKLQQKVIEDI